MPVALRNQGSADAHADCSPGTRAGQAANAFFGGGVDRATAGTLAAAICASVLQPEDLCRPVPLRWSAEAGQSADVMLPALSGAFSVTANAQGYYPGSSYVDWAGADSDKWTSEHSVSSPGFFSRSSRFSAGGIRQSAHCHSRAKMVSLRRHLEPGPPLFIQVNHGLCVNSAGVREVSYFDSACKKFGRYFNSKIFGSPPAPAASCALAGGRYSVPDIKVSRVARHAFDGGPCHVRTTAAG